MHVRVYEARDKVSPLEIDSFPSLVVTKPHDVALRNGDRLGVDSTGEKIDHATVSEKSLHRAAASRFQEFGNVEIRHQVHFVEVLGRPGWREEGSGLAVGRTSRNAC